MSARRASPHVRAGDAPSTSPRNRPTAWIVAGIVAAGIAAAGWAVAVRPAVPLPDLEAALAGADPMVALAILDAAAAVRGDPQSATAWGELGFLLVAHGADSPAAACFREAARRDPRSWRWPYFAAVVVGRSSAEEGVETIDEAVARDPAAPWPRLARAEWLAALGRLDEARGDFRAILAADPGHARARLGLARASLAAGDAEAVDLGDAAGHPSTRRAARELAAQVAARGGDAAAARRLAAEAAALPADAPWPDDPLAAELPGHTVAKRGRMALVRRLEAAGRSAEAAALTEKLEKQYPEVWWFVEGRLRAARGDRAGAEEAFRRALDIDPRAVEVHWERARVLADAGKGAEAADALRSLLAIEPLHGPAWLALGRALLAEDREAARTAFRKAVAAMPNSPEARRALADAEGSDR